MVGEIWFVECGNQTGQQPKRERILIKAHMWKLISGAQWNILGFLEVGEIERERAWQERKFWLKAFEAQSSTASWRAYTFEPEHCKRTYTIIAFARKKMPEIYELKIIWNNFFFSRQISKNFVMELIQLKIYREKKIIYVAFFFIF